MNNQRTAVRSLSLWWSACLVCLLVSGSAWSARCFQEADGVPGAYSDPPIWWGSGAAVLGSATGRWIDDPRWQGASSVSGLSDNYRFQALVQEDSGDRSLVLMWHVKAAPLQSSGSRADRLYFGFSDVTSGHSNLFRIDPQPLTSTGVDGETHAGSGFAGALYSNTGSGWSLNNSGGTVVPPLPGFLTDDARIDVFCESGPCDEWAIRVRLPIDPAADVTVDDPSGIKITAGGDYRFFYQIQSILPGEPLAAVYSHPVGLDLFETEASTSCTSITGLCIPDISTWDEFEDAPACDGDIGIDSSGIYVGSPGNHVISLTTTNDIEARPINNLSGADQDANAVQATFRIANWGSTIFDSPTWETVCSDVAANGSSPVGFSDPFEISCAFDVPQPCAYATAADPDGPANNLSCAGHPDLGTRHLDQCVLVTLGATNLHGPYFFAPQSAWQNLMFVGASTFVKEATLDIRGITALASGEPKRDLFVYVKTSNMPAELDEKADRPAQRLGAEAQMRLKRLQIQLPDAPAIGKEAGQRLLEAVKVGRLTYDEIKQVLPTYVAHVWHDSGKKLGDRRVLTGQPSFGYLVWHEGGLEGWKHQFEGQDVTEIATNFFRVSVPDGGVATVKTTIEAIEPGGSEPEPVTEPTVPPRHGSWWLALLLLALVASILLGICWILHRS